MARGRVVAALTALCLLAESASAALKDVGLTTLILTTPGWTQFDHITSVMNAYGAPYDIKVVQPSEIEGGTNALNMTNFMTNSETSGKYALIVATPSNVINIWGGVLSLNQINDLYAYQVAFGARMVLEGPYVPSFGTDIPGGPPGLGVQFLNADSPAPPGVVTATVLPSAPVTTSGVKTGAPVDLTGLYTTPVTITDTTRSTPVSQVVTPSAYAGGYTAVTTKFPSGREQFTTFYPCAAFSSDCLLTAHMYYAWGMHGIIPGSRDSQFSVQIDDLFLSTREPFDPTETKEYRMTPADSKAMATFVANVPNLPAGSNIKLEFVYNTGGYISKTQNFQYSSIYTGEDPPEQPQTYFKPPGSGTDIMPAVMDVSWFNSTLWNNDPLYVEITNGTSGLLYYLGHHTFNHENLNAITYHDAVQQIRLNQYAAGFWNTTNGKFNRFSQTAMVTPGISGFRNKDALRALVDTGITAAAGDSSWPHLRNQANPWLAQVTSAIDNSTIDGFYILPRSPTEVYFDVSTEALQTRLYNQIYCCDTNVNPTCSAGCDAGKPFPTASTWDNILAREALRVSRLMFALRPEGHMFHQANLRAAAGSTNGSLLRQWMTKVVAAYSTKVSWPLISMKLDDQLAYQKKRIARDTCKPQYTLQYDAATKAASQLTISSATGNCDVPVMIAGTVPVGGANANVRVMGKEPYLYTVNLPAGSNSQVLTLGAGANWS